MALGKMGSAAVRPTVADRLRQLLVGTPKEIADSSFSNDYEWEELQLVRRAAAETLARLKLEKEYDHVLARVGEWLSRGDSTDMSTAVECLRLIGPAAARPEIISAVAALVCREEWRRPFGHPWEDSRHAGLNALQHLGLGGASPEILSALPRLLTAPQHTGLPYETIRTLERLGPAAARPELVAKLHEMLLDPRAEVRANSASALTCIGWIDSCRA